MNHFALVATLTACLASPVSATDLASMNDAERQAFRNEVRAYLLENPEVLMEAIAVLEQRQASDQSQGDATLVQVDSDALFNDDMSYVGGNPEGDITVVEFLDYRCGFCKRAHPEVTALVSGDGNIRYIIKEFPILGEQSVLASRFAISTLQNAGPDAYAKVHDNLMTFRGDFSEKSLRRLAKDLNLDDDVIIDAMDSEAVTDVIAANHALGQRMQINGTPSFVMGDQMLRGYVPLADMLEIVAELRC